MQPRLGFAPALVDGKRVGLDQRAADDLGGLAEVLQRAVADQLGQAEITVARGDLADGGNDVRQPRFGESADDGRADGGDGKGQDRGVKHLQAERSQHADPKGRHRNPQRGSRKSSAAFRRHCMLTEGIPTRKFA